MIDGDVARGFAWLIILIAVAGIVVLVGGMMSRWRQQRAFDRAMREWDNEHAGDE